MFQAKLSSKFQLSIPKGIREDLQLEAGQRFTIVARGNILELIPTITVQNARGMLNLGDRVNSTSLNANPSNEYRDRTERNFN